MEEIYNVVGSKKLTRRNISFAPSWVLDAALTEELDANWTDTFEEVDDRQTGDNANVIPSHVVCKVNEPGERCQTDEGANLFKRKSRSNEENRPKGLPHRTIRHHKTYNVPGINIYFPSRLH